MATLNTLACANDVGNTGVGGCFYDPKNMIGAFLVPKGSEVDIASLQASLIAKTHHVSPSQRWYPVYGFETTTDSTEEKTVQTMPTGQKHVVREGYNDWKFQIVDGGLSLSLELRKFNGSNWDFIFIDGGDPSRGQALIGIVGSTSTKIKGIPSDGGFFWAAPFKLNDGSKITEYSVQYVFKSTYLNTKGLTAFVVTGFDLPTVVKGLQNVVLTGSAAVTKGTYYVTAKTEATGNDLGELYSTELASASMWSAKNATTGAVITISGVTYDADNGRFVLVLSTADTDYPTSGDINFNLVAPATLQAAGVDGYESTGVLAIASNGKD